MPGLGLGLGLGRSGGGELSLSRLLGWFAEAAGQTLGADASLPGLASWTRTGLATPTTGIADPEGGTGAYQYASDATTGEHRIQGAPTGATSGQPSITTIYVRKASGSAEVRYGVFTWVTGGAAVSIDFQTGTLVAGTGWIEDCGGGWYRLTMIGNAVTYARLRMQTSLVSANWDGGAYSCTVQVYAPDFNQRRLSAWASANGGGVTAAEATAQPLVLDDGSLYANITPLHAKTNVVPSAAGTLCGWVKRQWLGGMGVRALLGAEEGSSYCYLGIDANHWPVAAIGSQTETTIKASDGHDLPYEWCWIAVTWDGATVRLWRSSDDGESVVECYSGAQSGTVPATVPLAIMGVNDDGTVDTGWRGYVRSCAVHGTALGAAALARVMRQTRPADCESPEIVLPASITIVAGTTYYIRAENLIVRGNLSVTACDCPYTYADGELALTPATAGTYSLTLQATTAGGTDTASVSLDVIAPADPTQNVLVVADSLGAQPGYFIDLAAAALSNSTFVGTQVTDGDGTACEARPGWHLSEFRTKHIDDGDLSETNSPFASDGVTLDIAAYQAVIGVWPSVIVWAAGTNDVFRINAEEESAAGYVTRSLVALDEMIAAWDAAAAAASAPAIRHVLMLPGPGNNRQSAFDYCYNQEDQDRWAFVQKVRLWSKMAIERYASSSLEVVAQGVGVDGESGYESTNALHPNATGGARHAIPMIAVLQE